MDDPTNLTIFAIAFAVVCGFICIGLQKAAVRWKWFRIGGCAVLLLFVAWLGVMGIRQLMGE